MARSHALPLLLLLLVLERASARREPLQDQGGPPDPGTMDRDRALLLEAVKMEILSSLGLDREPRPIQKASEQELKTMFHLYWDTVTDMETNTSRPVTGSGESIVSTVLFPVGTVEVLRRRRHRPQSHKWNRVRFQKNPNIQNHLTVAQAKLKISRRIFESLSSAEQEIKIRLRGMKSVSSTAWKTSGVWDCSNSGFQDVTWDITSAAQMWMRTLDPWLAVDVRTVNGESMRTNLTFSMELSFFRAPQRPRRSNKEDDCDDRGWCCRKSTTVSFKDIGWTDWVVAPEQYTMHFCDGTCPHNYKPGSMHTQVKSRLHQITKGGTPRPCCVPAAYEPMVLMHYDSQGKLKLTPFKDFIVSKCQCA
ncbi:growth/differentiation factor 15 [Gouania willdenowi]|uniref:Growth/differentiation factor 15-like n=1 Tax=Gouania willdenowi TaxID=441366 RepID=A0A8C5GME1_GOUWI|nr:growth/differentiation factor 15-like [Gouania willdenowi]